MAARKLMAEHRGKVWTVEDIRAYTGRSKSWCQKRLKEIMAGKNTFKAVLNNKRLKNIQVEFVGKNKVYTVKLIMNATGVTCSTAYRRISLANDGCLKEDDLLLSPYAIRRKFRYSSIESQRRVREELTDEQRATLREFDDLALRDSKQRDKYY